VCDVGPNRILAVAPMVAAAKIPSAGVDPPLVRSRVAGQRSGPATPPGVFLPAQCRDNHLTESTASPATPSGHPTHRPPAPVPGAGFRELECHAVAAPAC
jgi:hypothetical protein